MAVASSLLAAVVSAVFAVQLLRRWATRGRTPATLYWGIALSLFCIASGSLAVGALAGWSSLTFRIFYLAGAVLNVPWLALGSIAINARRRPVSVVTGAASLITGALFLRGVAGPDPLLWWPGAVLAAVLAVPLLITRGRRLTRLTLVIVLVFSAIALVQVATAGFVASLDTSGLPEGRDVFPSAVRGMAVGGNAVGSVLVIVSALASSAHVVWRRPERDQARVFATVGAGRRAPVEALARWVYSGRRGARGAGHIVRGNLLIALGVFIAAMGGALSFLGDTVGHAVGLALGVVVMYAGFVRTMRPLEGTQAAAPASPRDAVPSSTRPRTPAGGGAGEEQ